MPFEPVDEVFGILKTLRDGGMAWIADEIKSVIAQGQTPVDRERTPAEYEEPRAEPYSEDDQIRITLETLRMYFLELPFVWESSRNQFREMLQVEDIEMYDAEEERVVVPFGEGYGEHYRSLRVLISRALEL